MSDDGGGSSGKRRPEEVGGDAMLYEYS